MYYFPNRPILIPPDPVNPMSPEPGYINSLEKSGKYIAEQKWNGDNVLIDLSTGQFWNRYKARHKYMPSPEVLDELSKWPKHAVLNAELMHNRTKFIKDVIIVHCIMGWKGKPLLGKTWGDSRHILEDMPGGKHVRVSEIHQSGFWQLFQAADGAIIEGIILKNPAGKLVYSTTPLANVSYMMKIRKPCKKYQF